MFYGSLKSFQGGHFVWFMCSVGADLTRSRALFACQQRAKQEMAPFFWTSHTEVLSVQTHHLSCHVVNTETRPKTALWEQKCLEGTA